MNKYFFIAALLFTISADAQKLFPFKEKDKFGYLDKDNNAKIAFICERADPFSEGKAFVKSGKFSGYIREDGSWAAVDTTIADGDRMQNGIAVIRREHEKRDDADYSRFDEAVVDSAGNIIVPFEEHFSFITRFNNLGLLICEKYVKSRKVCKLYTFDGRSIETDFSGSSGVGSNCMVGMEQNGKYWVFGRNAKLLLNYQVDKIFAETDGASIQLNNLYGLLDRNGKLLLPINYKRLFVSQFQPYASFSNNAGDSSAYINLDNGKIAFTFSAILFNPVIDDVAILSYINNLHNVHDLTGRNIGQIVSYEDTSRKNQTSYILHFLDMHFNSGIVPVRHPDNKWYGHNKQGQQVFQKGFDEEFEVIKGVAVVRENKRMGLVNASGNYILPAEYDYITPCKDRAHFMFTKDQTQGMCDATGKIIIRPASISIKEYWDGFFSISTYNGDNLYGYYNSNTDLYYFKTDK